MSGKTSRSNLFKLSWLRVSKSSSVSRVYLYIRAIDFISKGRYFSGCTASIYTFVQTDDSEGEKSPNLGATV